MLCTELKQNILERRNLIMKKIAATFFTSLIVMLLTASAFAYGPGWQNGNRYDDRGRYEPAGYQYDNRDRRVYYQHRSYYVPVRASQPVVYVPKPWMPGVTISFPNVSIQLW
jgi:hypothetical protein